ncbi:ROK family transcriptional regulator [Spirillospora sp. NPDC050679]
MTSGNRAEGMRRANASAVLRAVLGKGGVSRAEIVRQTGLSAPSVTKLTASLLEAGLLTEGEPLPSAELGRPRLPVRIDRTRRAALGVHIGLERTTLGLTALDGAVLAQRALHHHDLSPEGIVGQAADGVADFLREHRADREVLGTGVSIGGWVHEGTVVEHPSLGWSGVRLQELLSHRVPGPVRVQQHVRATAEAELWFGVGRHVDDLVVIFVGHVIDVAVVLNRTIHRGPGSAAGGIDHLPVAPESGAVCGCGRTGCLLAVANDAAVLAAAARRGLGGLDLEGLIEAADAGSAAAAEVLADRAAMVGRAVAVVLDLVNPGRVVLAGGVAKAPAHLDRLRAEAVAWARRGDDIPDRIAATDLGPGALVVSAAAPLLAEVLADPLGTLA